MALKHLKNFISFYFSFTFNIKSYDFSRSFSKYMLALLVAPKKECGSQHNMFKNLICPSPVPFLHLQLKCKYIAFFSDFSIRSQFLLLFSYTRFWLGLQICAGCCCFYSMKSLVFCLKRKTKNTYTHTHEVIYLYIYFCTQSAVSWRILWTIIVMINKMKKKKRK